MAVLEVITGPLSGTQIPLPRKREIIIGRDAACDIVVARGSVSRRHARLVCHDDGIYVEDMQSINGTFVNSKKADQLSKLCEGDRINIHDVCIIFHESADSMPASPADVTINTSDSYFGQVVIPESHSDRKARRRVGDQEREIEFVDCPSPLGEFTDIHQLFVATLDINEVLVALLELVFEKLPSVQNGRINILGEDRRLTPRALKHGRDEDSVVLSMQPVEDELASHVIRTGQIAVMSRQDTEWAIDDAGLLTVTVPIGVSSSGPALGVLHLELQSREKSLWNTEVQFLSEAGYVSGQMIQLAQRHEKLLAKERARWQTDAAHNVQMSLLPKTRPDVPGYSIGDYYKPAQNVGGDFFNYFPLPDGRVVIIVADVCGKGVAAALTMAELMTETRHAVSRSRTVKQAMSELNQAAFARDMGLVTYLMCVLDPRQHTASIVNAGHLPPLLRQHSSGTVRDLELQRGGVPFGFLPEQEFHVQAFELEPGDVLLMFTDGVHEASDGAEHRYGMERTRKLLASTAGEPQQVIDAVVSDVEQFCGSAGQFDDMCLVGLRRLIEDE